MERGDQGIHRTFHKRRIGNLLKREKGIRVA